MIAPPKAEAAASAALSTDSINEFQMILKSFTAIAGLFAGAMLAAPHAVKAGVENDHARRSWIRTLISELRTSNQYDSIKYSPLTVALFGVADIACGNRNATRELLGVVFAAPDANFAMQRFDKRYCSVQ